MDIPGKLDDWLIENWRRALHFLSVKWALLGTVVLPIMQLAPVFPKEVQELLPVWVRAPVAGIWCILFIVFRLKKPASSA